MFTLQYRFKQLRNNRYTKWYDASEHDSIYEGIEALGQHASKYFSFSVRLVDQDNKTVAEYKYKGQWALVFNSGHC